MQAEVFFQKLQIHFFYEEKIARSV